MLVCAHTFVAHCKIFNCFAKLMGGLKPEGQHFAAHTHTQRGILTGHTYIYDVCICTISVICESENKSKGYLASIPCSQSD